MKKGLAIAAIVLGLFVSVAGGMAFAQGSVTVTPPSNPPSTQNGSLTLPNPLGSNCADLTCPLNKVIDFVYTVALPICAIMVLIGGFQIMTAGGSAEKVSKGRKTIMYAAIGFVVIILAKGVSATIQSFFQ